MAAAASAAVRPGRYAAIDLGTVTCRLLVADVDEAGALHEIHRAYDIVNLGVGVDASGRLSADAMERAARTIGRYREEALSLGAGADVRFVAFATSAARDAANSDELVARIADAGVRLRVIPGELEASLSFSGASMDFGGQDLLVVDVGGGSTEVVAGVGGSAPSRAHSFNVGCRRMTERFLASDPPASSQLDRARAWVHSEMAPYFAQLRADGLAWRRVVAVAGTATTAVSVRERMQVYDKDAVHGYHVALPVLEDELRMLAGMPVRQRAEVVGLDPRRAPVIVAGLLILAEVLRLAEVEGYTASETDILQGSIMAAARGAFGELR